MRDTARVPHDLHAGEPVNEAARLCDLAKDHGGVLASGRLLALAGEDTAGRWTTIGSEVLRGRSEPTALNAPRK